MVQKINWARRALEDLRDIHDFIARDSARYAELQVERIRQGVEHLSDFPGLGKSILGFEHTRYREVVIDKYRVIYQVSGASLLVMSVIHGQRLRKGRY